MKSLGQLYCKTPHKQDISHHSLVVRFRLNISRMKATQLVFYIATLHHSRKHASLSHCGRWWWWYLLDLCNNTLKTWNSLLPLTLNSMVLASFDDQLVTMVARWLPKSYSTFISWYSFFIKKHFTDPSPYGYRCGFMGFSFLNGEIKCFTIILFGVQTIPKLGQWRLLCWHLYINLVFGLNTTSQDHFFNNPHFLLLRNSS